MGTKTISQTYSREGGLDHVVSNGGTITEAVSKQKWSGEAAVTVSIVNWVKGPDRGLKKLFRQEGDRRDSPWSVVELDEINSSLTDQVDVSGAKALLANKGTQNSCQGQTHGHSGFLLTPVQVEEMIEQDGSNAEVLFPFLNGDDLLTTHPVRASRFVIDFHPRDQVAASRYAAPFARIRKRVLPTREEAASKEEERNAAALRRNPKARINRHHANFLKRWWLLSYPRAELIEELATLKRYVVCSRVTKRPVFEFVGSAIRPNDAIVVFTCMDDYSFGVLQSELHWNWFMARCSTLEGRFRYTSETVFNSFPWPQSPTIKQVRRVAEASVALRALRRSLMKEHGMTLRDLYRTLDLPGEHQLKQAHAKLDCAVRASYGAKEDENALRFLLKLNAQLAKREQEQKPVMGPGLPSQFKEQRELYTDDAVGLD